MSGAFKVVRTDGELDLGRVDARLRDHGARVVVLPDGTGEDVLARELADADLLLTCYARITARVMASAPRLRAIIKYGVGIDAIDVEAARACRVPVANIPAYAEETVEIGRAHV